MLARALHHVSLHRFFNLFCRDIFFPEILFITRLQEYCGLILNLGSEDYLEKRKISFSIRIKPSRFIRRRPRALQRGSLTMQYVKNNFSYQSL